MSIDKAIETLNTNLTTLSRVVAELVVKLSDAPEPVKPSGKDKGFGPAEKKLAKAESAAKKDGPAAKKGGLDYKADVVPLMLEVISKCGRDELASVCARFGVINGQQLTAQQYPDFMVMLKESLAGVEAGAADLSEEESLV